METGYERRPDQRYDTSRRARSEPEVEHSARILAAETMAAAAAVIVAILGLADIYPEYMLPTTALLIGAAFLVKGSGIASRYRALARQTGSGAGPQVELAGGVSADICAGLAGVVLGVLALLEIAPLTLLAVSVIVFGAALLFSGGETYRVNQLARAWQARSDDEYNARMTAESAAGGEALVGIAAVVLGILALTGIEPGTLVFSGLLAVAGIMVLSGMASGLHAATLLRR